MPYNHDDVLTAVQGVYPQTADVAQIYSDDDTQWWVEAVEHNVFAIAWYDENADLNTRPYTP